MNKEQYHKAFRNVIVSDKVIESLIEKLNTDKIKPIRRLNKRMFVLLIAAILVLSCVTVGATGVFNSVDWFKKGYNANTKYKEQLIEQASKNVIASTTSGNYIIKVVGIIGYKHRAEFLIELSLKSGNKISNRAMTSFDYEVENTPTSSCGGPNEDLSKEKFANMNLEEYLIYSDTPLIGQTVILKGKGITKALTENQTSLSSEPWKLEFTLDYTDLTQVYTLNEPVTFNDTDLIIQSLELSPFTAYVKFDFATTPTQAKLESLNKPCWSMEQKEKPTIRYDGVDIPLNMLGRYDETGFGNTNYFIEAQEVFQSIIDPGKVKYIEIGDEKIPLNS
ncbi:hypothetical protein RBG61_09785 [Paludicola sp. MB14-C6]|uniref:hypothetical protein n=1 Tax=Paludihabitans sp. MB14-C6 TaxID=3070656 RepID=UPI0027DE7435|nr:hypothetical protein [Paludicola sp. MB14-C6]WMJ22277.1 hypothetical protein RBG61_09785 [Paludicola sp. MB14-C6]